MSYRFKAEYYELLSETIKRYTNIIQANSSLLYDDNTDMQALASDSSKKCRSILEVLTPILHKVSKNDEENNRPIFNKLEMEMFIKKMEELEDTVCQEDLGDDDDFPLTRLARYAFEKLGSPLIFSSSSPSPTRDLLSMPSPSSPTQFVFSPARSATPVMRTPSPIPPYLLNEYWGADTSMPSSSPKRPPR